MTARYDPSAPTSVSSPPLTVLTLVSQCRMTLGTPCAQPAIRGCLRAKLVELPGD